MDGEPDGFADDDGETDGDGERGGGDGGTGRTETRPASGDRSATDGEVVEVSGVYVYVLSGSSSGISPAPAPPKSMSAPGNCSSTGAGR
ncbi:hypothetical protein Q0Z83_077680 [Actinoplanes sichuanensis]|nr:hypothetical protein Q0Z83_077680 [Actinoplanes sichuanensis]